MWIEQAHHGGFVFPLRSGEVVSSSKALRGYEGELSLYGVDVSGECTNYIEFCNGMKQKEATLLHQIGIHEN